VLCLCARKKRIKIAIACFFGTNELLNHVLFREKDIEWLAKHEGS